MGVVGVHWRARGAGHRAGHLDRRVRGHWLAQTAYSYWNSASIALRSMNAYPVSELEQPELYAIVRELPSARATMPLHMGGADG